MNLKKADVGSVARRGNGSITKAWQRGRSGTVRIAITHSGRRLYGTICVKYSKSGSVLIIPRLSKTPTVRPNAPLLGTDHRWAEGGEGTKYPMLRYNKQSLSIVICQQWRLTKQGNEEVASAQ